MTEFRLRTKMYVLRVDGKKDTKNIKVSRLTSNIKRVKTNVKSIMFEVRCLFDETEMT